MVDKVRGKGQAPKPQEVEAQAQQPPEPPKLRKTPAGYMIVPGYNIVVGGQYEGEFAKICDSRFDSQAPNLYRLFGIQMTKQEAECVRTAWTLSKEQLVLDGEIQAQGTYCIEKMDDQTYERLLFDEKYESYRNCLNDTSVDGLIGMLSLKVREEQRELDKTFSPVNIGLGVGGAALLFSMFVWPGHHLGDWIQPRWRNFIDKIFKGKGGNGDGAAGGGGDDGVPKLVDGPAPDPSSKFSALDPYDSDAVDSAIPEVSPEFIEDDFDSDAVYEYKPVPLGDAVKSMADEVGLIAAGVMGAIMMYFAPGIGLGLQGSTAGGAFIVGPGAKNNDGMVFSSYTGPTA